jgi:hypothetical protein
MAVPWCPNLDFRLGPMPGDATSSDQVLGQGRVPHRPHRRLWLLAGVAAITNTNRRGMAFHRTVWNYSGGVLPLASPTPAAQSALRPNEGYILTGAPSPVMWKALIGKGPTLSKLRRSFLMRIFDLAGTRPYG